MQVEISSCHITYADEKPGHEVLRISLGYNEKARAHHRFSVSDLVHYELISRIAAVPELTLAHDVMGAGVVVDASAYDLGAAICGLKKLNLQKTDDCTISIRHPLNAYQEADYVRAGEALRDVYRAAKELRTKNPLLAADDIRKVRIHPVRDEALVQVTLAQKADPARFGVVLDNIGARISTNHRPHMNFYLAASGLTKTLGNKLDEFVPGAVQACLPDRIHSCRSMSSALGLLQAQKIG